jgi:hypothetical protein
VTTPAIDWSRHDQYPEDTATCECGRSWLTHGKFVYAPAPHVEARKPCPGCGKTDKFARLSSAPELMAIRGPKT